jgi:hypothetical protein
MPDVSLNQGTEFRSRLDRPWLCALIVFVTTSAFVVARLAVHGFDPFVFVRPGRVPADSSLPVSELASSKQAYDGRYYYRLAVSPMTWERSAYGVTLDHPAYRHQRILYPSLAWALSLGQAGAVPYTLILVNVIFLIALAWLSAVLAQQFGAHALASLVIPLYPGFVISLSRDLSEIVSCTFLAATVLLLMRSRFGWAAVVGTLAVLARETTVLLSAGTVAWWIWRRVRGQEAPPGLLAAGAIPIGICMAWQGFLYGWWGDHPLEVGAGITMVPFTDIYAMCSNALRDGTSKGRRSLVELAVVLALLVTCLYTLRRSTAIAPVKIGWLIHIALASVLGYWTMGKEVSFLRALSEYFVLGVVILFGGPARLRILMSVIWMGLGLLHLVRTVTH